MRQHLTALFNKPAFLVGLMALLTALVVQPGDLGTMDTVRRLQTTRSLWTSAPAVFPGDFGLVGRNGRRHYWYGMGQSLLMLPADILARSTTKLISRFREPWWLLREDVIVSCITSVLVSTLAILVCFHFLRLFTFTVNESIAGACTLLLGTTFLHYTQNLQENNFLLLLTLTGLHFQYRWLKSGSIRSLFGGSVAFGANLLTRLTTGMDLLAGALFISLCLWWDKDHRRGMLDRLIEYGRTCIPCYMAFFTVDRLYQYYRFGSPFNTYLQIWAVQYKQYKQSQGVIWGIEPGFPWSTPFREGFLGPLITPGKSIFLFDPLILLTALLTLGFWKHLASDTKAYVIALAWLLLSYIIFYAKYYDWSGDNAWGDRFVTTPVQLLAMISIPLLMRHRATLKPWTWKFGKAIAAMSVVIQIASLFFSHNLELAQMHTLKQPTFVIGLRFLNIAALATGMTEKWGLSNQYTLASPRLSTPLSNQYTLASPRLSTPYFFPFLVMRGELRGHVGKVAILIAGWICLLAALVWLFSLIKGRMRHREETS